jgi:hypothetical protein
MRQNELMQKRVGDLVKLDCLQGVKRPSHA